MSANLITFTLNDGVAFGFTSDEGLREAGVLALMDAGIRSIDESSLVRIEVEDLETGKFYAYKGKRSIHNYAGHLPGINEQLAERWEEADSE